MARRAMIAHWRLSRLVDLTRTALLIILISIYFDLCIQSVQTFYVAGRFSFSESFPQLFGYACFSMGSRFRHDPQLGMDLAIHGLTLRNPPTVIRGASSPAGLPSIAMIGF